VSHTDAPDAYETLVDHVQQTTYISDATQLIGWDQQVQLSALSSVLHERQTDETLGEALAALEDADLTDEQAAVVRETRESYEEATRVPESLVRERTELSAEAQDAWESAKADDAFEQFAPVLERRRELERERADHLDPDREPYRVMYEGLEPAFPEPLIESILRRRTTRPLRRR
jgi:carboxypeptidase Taq